MYIPVPLRWVFGVTLAAFIVLAPTVYFRSVYEHSRRLRAVEPGVLYRSGQLTVEGFTDAVTRHGIKTVVNLQDQFPDPDIQNSYLDMSTTPETELCDRLGVRYVFIAPDLISRRKVGNDRPVAIDQFLALMDDPTNYPVLIHCKAGLHRTGILAAVYRMEYQGWSNKVALIESITHGFRPTAATSANNYITQYILTYLPGQRRLDPAGD